MYLNCVRRIHWYVSALSRKGTVRVTLWYRDSTFTLPPTQTHADHTALGWIALEDKHIYSPHMAETVRRMRSEKRLVIPPVEGR